MTPVIVFLYIEMSPVFQHDWFFGSWDQDDHVPVDEQSETPTNPSVTRLSCDDDGRFYKSYEGEFICQMDQTSFKSLDIHLNCHTNGK